MRLGLVGAGRWGTRYIATIGAMPDIELAYLASGNPVSKNLVPNSCIVTPDWQDLIAANLDGIIIATPPHTHAAIALTAIEAGLPVLIEKPLTLATADAEQIADAAARRGVLVVVDHTHLYSPAYRELKRRGAKLGSLQSLRSCGANWGPFRPDTPMLWDYAPHDIAMCIDLAGCPPSEWNAVEEKQGNATEGAGSAIRLCLSFSGPVNAQIRVSNIDQHKSRWIEVTYAGGTLRYDDLCESKLSFAPDAIKTAAQEIPVAATPPLTVAIKEFCANVQAGIRSDPGLELGIRVVDILAACDQKLHAPGLLTQSKWN